MMRSRGRWLEYGEKYTKYFLSWENRNHTRKHIRKLCLSGVITTNYEKLLDLSSKYYKNLYRRKVNTVQPNILGNFLGQARITKLSEEDRLSCEGLITIEECVKALNTFEKGKNPDFFPPLVIKGNEFVYFNKGKHTSFASRVYENGRGRLRVLRPFRAMSKKKKKKKISGNKIYVSRSRRVTKSRDRTFRVPHTQRFARPS